MECACEGVKGGSAGVEGGERVCNLLSSPLHNWPGAGGGPSKTVRVWGCEGVRVEGVRVEGMRM